MTKETSDDVIPPVTCLTFLHGGGFAFPPRTVHISAATTGSSSVPELSPRFLLPIEFIAESDSVPQLRSVPRTRYFIGSEEFKSCFGFNAPPFLGGRCFSLPLSMTLTRAEPNLLPEIISVTYTRLCLCSEEFKNSCDISAQPQYGGRGFSVNLSRSLTTEFNSPVRSGSLQFGSCYQYRIRFTVISVLGGNPVFISNYAMTEAVNSTEPESEAVDSTESKSETVYSTESESEAEDSTESESEAVNSTESETSDTVSILSVSAHVFKEALDLAAQNKQILKVLVGPRIKLSRDMAKQCLLDYDRLLPDGSYKKIETLTVKQVFPNSWETMFEILQKNLKKYAGN